jgi:hypothetical protein
MENAGSALASMQSPEAGDDEVEAIGQVTHKREVPPSLARFRLMNTYAMQADRPGAAAVVAKLRR